LKNILERIIILAQEEWKDDYNMQLTTIEDMYYANIIIEHIRNSSKKNPIIIYLIDEVKIEWEDDFSMQLDEIIEKLSKKKDLQEFITYPIPTNILSSIINKAKNEWKNDIDMTNATIKDEVISYLKIEKYLV